MPVVCMVEAQVQGSGLPCQALEVGKREVRPTSAAFTASGTAVCVWVLLLL